MPTPFSIADLTYLAPWLIVSASALVVLMADVFAGRPARRTYAGVLALVGLLLAAASMLSTWGLAPEPVFSGYAVADDFGRFFTLVFLGATAFAVLLGMGYFEEHGLQRGEFYALTLMSLSGMILMGMAGDLLTFFVGLEVMSVAVYALAAYQRHESRSVEAALKYFLMGSFATAFLLYGMALVYGATGSTSLKVIAEFARVQGASSLYLVVGMVLVLIGMAFKVAAVPFHMWTPDAYEGSPTPVTAFMAAAVKAAAFAAFVRVFATAFFPLKLGPMGWYNLIYLIAIVTMTWGNLAALVQDNVKRMLAYSSIAHAGYILVGFLTITQNPKTSGAATVLFYLIAYAIMNFGAFGIVTLLGRRGDENLDLTKGWSGLGLRFPAIGAAMALFMFSLAGMPPTIGFTAKFYVFREAVDQGLIILAVIGVLNSLISAYYYLRVVVHLYMQPMGEKRVQPLSLLPVQIALMLLVAATLYFGILPGDLLTSAQTAVLSLF